MIEDIFAYTINMYNILKIVTLARVPKITCHKTYLQIPCL